MTIFDREATKDRLLEIVRASGPHGVSGTDLVNALVAEGHANNVVRSVIWELRPCSGDTIRLNNERNLVAL